MAKSKKETNKEELEKVPKGYIPRLKEIFTKEIVPSLIKEMAVSSRMAVPRLTKIVIGMGIADAKENIQFLEKAKEDLTVIVGQMPQIRRAKKSISNFKLREGMPIGLKVTLRGNRMYEFLDRFVSTACPRIRDFQGFDTKFDGKGNMNLGLREHHIFPEINMEKSPKPYGMNISFITTAKSDADGLLLLKSLGIPFKKEKGARG
jgi:large subunit ribosomal protein L5